MIRLEFISKRYEMGEVCVTALDNASLDIDRGEFVVVLGPSGSGKTTLLNIIGALDVPTEGTVHINGGDLNLTQKGSRFRFRRETVSFIFQSFNLFPSLTALENVQFVLDMTNTPDSRAKA
ncbi:MAG: ABC transporter ATP-binding protein, partial [Anaerolineae bacterium]|nr:ABC transporter ATP-binding protein [Anaerolineae bacterium]